MWLVTSAKVQAMPQQYSERNLLYVVRGWKGLGGCRDEFDTRITCLGDIDPTRGRLDETRLSLEMT